MLSQDIQNIIILPHNKHIITNEIFHILILRSLESSEEIIPTADLNSDA